MLEGEPASYSPISGDTYLDWYFGPAEPGEYTLNVPLRLSVSGRAAGKQSVQISLDSGESSAGTSLSLPGGKLTLGRLFPIDSVTDYCQNLSDIYDQVGYRWWALEAVWEGEDPARVAAVIPVGAEHTGYTVVDGVSYHNTEANLWTQTVSDAGAEKPYTLVNGYVLGAMEGQDSVTISTQPGGVYYRWNHAFTIPMTVQPEQERASFTESAEMYSLTATPRRVNGEVTLTLRPSSSQDTIVPSGNIVRSPLATLGVQDAPITLTAADGTVYEGGFQARPHGRLQQLDVRGHPRRDLHPPCPVSLHNGPAIDIRIVPLPQNEGGGLPRWAFVYELWQQRRHGHRRRAGTGYRFPYELPFLYHYQCLRRHLLAGANPVGVAAVALPAVGLGGLHPGGRGSSAVLYRGGLFFGRLRAAVRF